MDTYTVFWSIDVELEARASIEDHARHAAEICRRMNLGDPEAANVFHVAGHGGRAVRLLREAGENATRVDLGGGKAPDAESSPEGSRGVALKGSCGSLDQKTTLRSEVPP